MRWRTVESIASLRNAFKTLHNDAVGRAVRGRNGSQIARSRAPRARARKLARAWIAQTCNSQAATARKSH
eukprot:5320329-Lingulodinium_polyedra.AAC.1